MHQIEGKVIFSRTERITLSFYLHFDDFNFDDNLKKIFLYFI